MSLLGPTRVRFGEFEADLQACELFRSGLRVPVQEKPFLILKLLLTRPGELITRMQIFEEVWPGTHVLQDQSLNTAMRKLRLALCDSSQTPQFIETVGSRGYRFICPVEAVGAGLFPVRETRLAVLPFEAVGPHTDEHFSDGITEEMTIRLGRMHPQFCVIAPTSVMRYKRTLKNLDEVLRELAVDYVLAGSIQSWSRRVRITARLIRSSDQKCLWCDGWERDLGDVFALQNEIAEKVARSTMRMLNAPGVSGSPISSAAHEAYLRGRFFWNKRTAPAMLKSLDFFEQAIALDPGYSLAYVGLADAYVMLGQHGILRSLEAFPRAQQAAQKALSIDPATAEAHVALAWAKVVLERDFAAAEAECREALHFNPSHAFACAAFAFVLTTQGRHNESISALKRALHLDPVSLPTNSFYAAALYFARRYDAAMEQCAQCLELDPNFPTTYGICGQVLEIQGKFDEAVARFDEHRRLAPRNPLAIAHLARLCARMGQQTRALELIQPLLDGSVERYVPAYFVAMMYGAMGDADNLFHWLRRAEVERSNWILFMGVDPKLDDFRSDPRYAELLDKIGLSGLAVRTIGESAARI